MGTPIYQHWVGKMVVEAGSVPAVTHDVDSWFPADKPPGAVLIAVDDLPTATPLFPHLIQVKTRIVLLKVTVNVNLLFTGTVEHWQLPGVS